MNTVQLMEANQINMAIAASASSDARSPAERIADSERSIANAANEIAIAFDADGNELFVQKGAGGSRRGHMSMTVWATWCLNGTDRERMRATSSGTTI